jgi:two-component system, NarL family, sensor histidine kinase DesK
VRSMVADLPGPRIVLSLPERGPVTDEERAIAALRLVQEALTNALRHGEPGRIAIALRCEGDTLSIEVRDDGRGCERIEPGNGLRGMRERIERIGGSLTLDGRPGAGFTVHAELPSEPRA